MSSGDEFPAQLKPTTQEKTLPGTETQPPALPFLPFVETMLNTLEVRAAFLVEQAHRVGQYAAATARQLALSPEEIENIRLAGLLHNYGAVSVPDNILNKPGRLTDEEMDILRNSVLVGARLLRHLPGAEHMVAIIASQSEWFNGKGGFPGQKHGEEVPLGARIVAVSKTYDALTATRLYRQPMTSQEALDFLTSQAGTQFDPQVVEAFKTSLGQ
jgi:response regulator RpfG family c-di-GMP phosphodiesterase